MVEPRTYRQARFEPPPGATELLLVRHGESQAATEGQPFPLVDGQGDPALAPEGREQAAQVCERLAGERIDAIYVSNLRRTAQTAEPLAARTGLSPVVDPDLREVHLGDWEGGVFRKMVAERHPISLRIYEEQRWDVIPGAETIEAFAARVRDAVLRIATAHVGKRVAVFTHGGVVSQILCEATGSRPLAFVGSDNAAISHVVITDGRWIVRRFNDTAHFEPHFTLRPDPLE